TTPPLGGLKVIALMQIEGRDVNVFVNQVDPRYLTTMRIQLLRGRDLISGDEHSVVVSESLASRNWPTGDPLGQPIRIGQESLTVVGIAKNARTLAPGDPDTAELYRLPPQANVTSLAVLARTSAPAETLAPAFRAVANSMDPVFKP